MSGLLAIHGHVVELRRHVNEHLRHLRPFMPTERYELWLRTSDGAERKFTLHTREMPARRGHEVSLITTQHNPPQVLALANWTTVDGVNYARSEPAGVVRGVELAGLAAALVGASAWLGFAGLVYGLVVAPALMAIVAAIRWLARRWLACLVDLAIDEEAVRCAKGALTLH